MRSITKVVISFLELLEAEGRSFRKSAIVAAENITVIFFALFMLFAGAAVALFSLYLWLSVRVGRIGGSAIIAALLLLAGGYLLMAAHSRGLRGEPLFPGAKGEKNLTQTEEESNGQ